MDELDDGRIPVDRLVPRPTPSAYLLLDAQERDWRARVCVALLDSGFETRIAWMFALSNDTSWCEFTRRQLVCLTDVQVEVILMRRRLAEFVSPAA